jgi:polysaccharide export outer membrane protein
MDSLLGLRMAVGLGLGLALAGAGQGPSALAAEPAGSNPRASAPARNPAATNDAPPAVPPIVQVINAAASDSGTYRISANDTIRVKVYQEDDLTSELRISKDGSTTFPLLGGINVGGKTVEEATGLIRDLLAKDYLVNPQVTITVIEYAKRRFTVLGQVGKPGSYEFPNEEGMTLLQAIGMAGGFTRLARSSKVTITRTMGGKKTLTVDVKANTNDPETKQFEILPDDTINVDERVF